MVWSRHHRRLEYQVVRRQKDFGKNLLGDYKIRDYIKTNYYDAAISKIMISRAADLR